MKKKKLLKTNGLKNKCLKLKLVTITASIYTEKYEMQLQILVLNISLLYKLFS